MNFHSSRTSVRSMDPPALSPSTTAVVPTLPNKTLMSLSLFEPNHLGHEPLAMTYDYHLDLALSLISSVSSSYSSDFVLQAVETSNSAEVLRAILAQHSYDTSENGCLFLNDEPIDASITILINLDDLSVNFYSSKHQENARRQERTKLVQPLLDHARLARQLLPADFVLLNMEDSLQEIYFQALAILKYIRANSRSVSAFVVVIREQIPLRSYCDGRCSLISSFLRSTSDEGRNLTSTEWKENGLLLPLCTFQLQKNRTILFPQSFLTSMRNLSRLRGWSVIRGKTFFSLDRRHRWCWSNRLFRRDFFLLISLAVFLISLLHACVRRRRNNCFLPPV